MALDNATRICGAAIFQDKNLTYSGTIEANKNEKNYMNRIEEIFNRIRELVKQYNINYIVFEDSHLARSAGNNVDTLKKLCRLQGAIMSIGFLEDVGLYLFSPAEWRSKLWKNCGNKREVQKKLAVDYVNEHYGLSLDYGEHDRAEAICLGTAFLKIQK